MEIDDLKYVWKKMDEPAAVIQSSEYFVGLTQKKFQDPVSRMRRNLFLEGVLAIVLYVPVIGWYLLGFNGKLPEPAIFLTAMAILFGIYYFRKKKLLDNLQCADCQVKKNLEKQLTELERYTRSYFYAGVIAVPLFLLLFLFLLYWKLPPSNSFFYPHPGHSTGKVVAIWGIVFSGCTFFAFYANRWYTKKLYGVPIQKLKAVLQEMQDV